MTRPAFAILTLITGALLGFTGMVLLYDAQTLGAAYPLLLTLLAAAVIGSGWIAGRPLAGRNLWLYAPALFFAAMVAIRADGWLSFYNFSLSLVLGALALHYMRHSTPFDLSSTAEQTGAVIAVIFRSALELPFATLFVSRHGFNRDEADDNGTTAAVIRGVLLTLPVLVVFALLLGSADAVFANYLPSFQWLANLNVDEAIGRAIFAGALAWLAVGAITYGVARDWDYTPNPQDNDPDHTPEVAPDDNPEQPIKRGRARLPRVSMIEGGILLGGVALLFGAFVLVQFVYLFGGQENIGVDGMTYAEYARRGFFELVTVAVLTMGLLLISDRLILRDGRRETRLFRVLALVIIGLVGVMLLSAARRMGLYTDEFGLTRLRLWTSVFMAWLAILFGVLMFALFRVRRHVFSFGLVLVAIGFFGTMNLIVPDARIAAHNIDRALERDEEVDLCYLSTLSADAVPVIAERYRATNASSLENLLAVFERQHNTYQARASASPLSYNTAWAAAGHALDGMTFDTDQTNDVLASSACNRSLEYTR